MSDNAIEVLVVGEGLAGITAAASAAANGKRVMLVSKGPGSFALGSACIDVAGLNKWPPEQVDKGIARFVELAASAGCGYNGGLVERRLIPSITGTFQEVSLAPNSLWNGDPRTAATTVVAGIENLVGFDANFVAERLQFNAHRIGLNTSYRGAVITLAEFHRGSVTPLEIATRFDRDPGYRNALLTRMKKAADGAELLIAPGILGLQSVDADFSLFEEDIGCAICELPTLPPSVPGLRLLQKLERALNSLGVELSIGFAATKLCIQSGWCTSVELDTPGRSRIVPVDAVVLACGRFAHLPDSCGVDHVDQVLQPVDARGEVIAHNLLACGSLLSNVAPRQVNAMAIISGFEAAQLACEQGVLYAAR